MALRVLTLRFAPWFAMGLVLTVAGCLGDNPNAVDIKPPVVDASTPRTSEEAAQQSEPPPVEARGKKAR